MKIHEMKWELGNLVVKEYARLPVVETKLMRLGDALRDL